MSVPEDSPEGSKRKRGGGKQHAATGSSPAEAPEPVGAGGEAWYDRLSFLDAAFLDIEQPTAPMHVGSVSIFEGKAPELSELIDLIAARLVLVPRYIQKLASVPFGVGRPVWVDDPDFDLANHVKRMTLPRPGGMNSLRRLAGELFSRHLDRNLPLWELWLVDGLGRGRFAVITKTHHCMVDGVSGVDVASVLLDTSSDPLPDAKPDSSRAARPAPSFVSLLTDAVIDQIRQPLDLVREAAFPRAGGRRPLLELAGGLMPLIEIGKLGPAPPSSLNLPVGPERLWEMLSISLADIKRVRTGLGGTVNDVVLAVIAGALRSLLLGRNETVPEELRVLVPVNVRRPDARGTLGNQVAAFFCPLPVGEPDAVNRLRQISAVTKGLKESGQAIGAMALTRLGDFAPPALAALATRLQSVAPWFNIVVTNVPGPQVPLFLMGHRLTACYPAVPLTTYTTVSVALLSYNGMIGIGLLGDADHASDLPRLAQSIPSALVELVRAAGKGPGAPGGD